MIQISVPGGVTDIVTIRDELMVATKDGHILRYILSHSLTFLSPYVTFTVTIRDELMVATKDGHILRYIISLFLSCLSPYVTFIVMIRNELMVATKDGSYSYPQVYHLAFSRLSLSLCENDLNAQYITRFF